jgi:hypothetical protein
MGEIFSRFVSGLAEVLGGSGYPELAGFGAAA